MTMRSYPTNSTRAAARIVALAMLADGHLDRGELAVLDRAIAASELGIEQREWDEVVAALCSDLSVSGELCWQSACRAGIQSIGALLAEIDEAELCLKVLRVCAGLLEASSHVTDAETTVIEALIARWRELCARHACARIGGIAAAVPLR
jgi:hypothetical protein